MNEIAAEPITHQTLVREVFIDPIRSVVVIDDEFPTLDDLVLRELLSAEGRAPSTKDEEMALGRKWKSEDVIKVKEILKFAREKTRPWLVDVHDGNKVKTTAEEKIAPSLDHSDLMVLDYHLDGEEGSGEAAIKIMRRLAKNKHHNLVIVYTKGYPGDPNRVLREIALGLAFPDEGLGSFEKESKEKIETALSTWDDELPGFVEKLKEEISADVYLTCRSTKKYRAFLYGKEGEQLKSLLGEKLKTVDVDSLMRWLFLQRQDQLATRMSMANLGEIRHGGTEDCNWLQSDNLFVTIVSKQTAPAEFERKLVAALESSSPSPHRLLVSMMRAVIGEHGSAAETAILSNRPVQTAWLDDLLNPSPSDENTAILSTINRHWEALGDQLRRRLQPFSADLRNVFLAMEAETVFSNCGLNKSDLKDRSTILSYNQFISTKAFDRQHLTTGHIFSTPTKSSDGSVLTEYWICLTPACDMIPEQKKDSGWNARLGEASPFNAFKLFPANNAGAEMASRNSYVYFDLDGTPAAFSIYPDNGNMHFNPEWEQMFASNFARFSQDAKFTVTKTTSVNGNLQLDMSDAFVVSQLRSEYALNLLQRVGAFLSRPGLGMGFKSLLVPPKPTNKGASASSPA